MVVSLKCGTLGIFAVKRLHRKNCQRKICWRGGRLEERERLLAVSCLVLILMFEALGVYLIDRLHRKKFQSGIFLIKGELSERGHSLAGEVCCVFCSVLLMVQLLGRLLV